MQFDNQIGEVILVAALGLLLNFPVLNAEQPGIAKEHLSVALRNYLSPVGGRVIPLLIGRVRLVDCCDRCDMSVGAGIINSLSKQWVPMVSTFAALYATGDLSDQCFTRHYSFLLLRLCTMGGGAKEFLICLVGGYAFRRGLCLL